MIADDVCIIHVLPEHNALSTNLSTQRYLTQAIKEAQEKIDDWTATRDKRKALLAKAVAEEPGVRAGLERARERVAAEYNAERAEKEDKLRRLREQIAALEAEVE